MKRYDPPKVQRNGERFLSLDESPQGRWVRWEDTEMLRQSTEMLAVTLERILNELPIWNHPTLPEPFYDIHATLQGGARQLIQEVRDECEKAGVHLHPYGTRFER